MGCNLLTKYFVTRTVRPAAGSNSILAAPPIALAWIEPEIRETIRAHSRFHGSGAKIRVLGGVVFVSATFQHPRGELFFKQRVAEIVGVIAIEIDPMFHAWIRPTLATDS